VTPALDAALVAEDSVRAGTIARLDVAQLTRTTLEKLIEPPGH
jgi:hypothetical protein